MATTTSALAVISTLFTAIKIDLLKLRRFIDENIRAPPATSFNVYKVIKFIMTESATALTGLTISETAYYSRAYSYAYDTLQVIDRYLAIVGRNMGTVEAYLASRSMSMWVDDASAESLEQEVEHMMWVNGQAIEEVWSSIVGGAHADSRNFA